MNESLFSATTLILCSKIFKITSQRSFCSVQHQFLEAWVEYYGNLLEYFFKIFHQWPFQEPFYQIKVKIFKKDFGFFLRRQQGRKIAHVQQHKSIIYVFVRRMNANHFMVLYKKRVALCCGIERKDTKHGIEGLEIHPKLQSLLLQITRITFLDFLYLTLPLLFSILQLECCLLKRKRALSTTEHCQIYTFGDQSLVGHFLFPLVYRLSSSPVSV